jgi:hypothetical protein
MIEVTGRGDVIYKTGGNRPGRFPEAGIEDLLAGPKFNCQVFEPLDFLVRCPARTRRRRTADSLLRILLAWLWTAGVESCLGRTPSPYRSRILITR